MAVNPASSLPIASEKAPFVRAMFDRIAPRYDLINRLMTFGLDQSWRRAMIEALGIGPDTVVVDLAAGTGDLTALAKRVGARVVGIDFAGAMLRAGHKRRPDLALVQGDASALPLPDACIDAITCGFAVRNFADLETVFQECARVLRPGGQLGLLEVDTPSLSVLRRLHEFHFRTLVPWFGGWLSDREAYRYLPESTSFLPDPETMAHLLENAGFETVRRRSHGFGAVQRVLARKAP